jgi:hypothetical protein
MLEFSHPDDTADAIVCAVCCRFEDVTPPETVRLNPKADRSLLLYGYLRGSPLKPHTRIHLAGVGDFELEVSCYSGHLKKEWEDGCR